MHFTTCAVSLAILLGWQDKPGEKQDKKPSDQAATDQTQQKKRPAIPTDKRGGRVLRLSLGDCLKLGDGNNVDLTLAKLLERLAAEDVKLADSVFEPELFATAEWRRSKSVSRNAFQPSITSKVYSGSAGLRKRVVTGGSLELAFSPSYVDQRVSSQFSFPSTFFTGDLTFTLSQPLLRGAWFDSNLADYDAAMKERAARRDDYERTRQTILDSIAGAYFNLIFTREDWVVRYQALELAREQLRNTLKKIELGDLAPRDKVVDEAEVAKKEEELIVAEHGILDAEDALRRLILPFREDDAWDVVILPTDLLGERDPELAVPTVREAVGAARKQRPDVAAGRKRVDSAVRRLSKADQDLLPGLDFTAIYNASSQAENGRRLNRQIWESEFPTYTLRLAFTLPIGNLAAKSAHRKALLELEQAQRTLQILQIDIHHDVRAAVRGLTTLRNTIAAARESQRLAESNLDAVQIKVRLGSESPFEIQRRSQELQDARSRLLRARLDYRIAWFNLLAVVGEINSASKLPEVEK